MYIKSYLLLTFALLLPTKSSAKIEKDTLFSSSRQDRVIISFDISRENDNVTISFMEARKILGEAIAKKYKKQDEIDIVFFDNIGIYDKMRFDGLSTKAFMIPRNDIEYTKSADGYFLMKQSPKLTFKVKADNPLTIKVPIYIAHHEKKGVYKVLTQCDDLIIRLPKATASRSRQDAVTSRTTSQTVTTTEELGDDMPDFEFKALALVDFISAIVMKSELTDREIEELDEYAKQLRELSLLKFTNKDTEVEVSQALSEYNNRREELDEQKKLAEETASKEAEEKARLIAEKEQARQDSIAALAQQKADEEKQRNQWMIIGGVILAVLGYAGNQVLKHFRDKKNQENITKMQENAIKQAEKEAKRRTEGYAKERAKQAGDVAKNAANKIGKKDITNTIKKKSNKGISI